MINNNKMETDIRIVLEIDRERERKRAREREIYREKGVNVMTSFERH